MGHLLGGVSHALLPHIQCKGSIILSTTWYSGLFLLPAYSDPIYLQPPGFRSSQDLVSHFGSLCITATRLHYVPRHRGHSPQLTLLTSGDVYPVHYEGTDICNLETSDPIVKGCTSFESYLSPLSEAESSTLLLGASTAVTQHFVAMPQISPVALTISNLDMDSLQSEKTLFEAPSPALTSELQEVIVALIYAIGNSLLSPALGP